MLHDQVKGWRKVGGRKGMDPLGFDRTIPQPKTSLFKK